MPILRVIAGPHSGQQFSLSEGSAEVGREAGCGIPLPGDSSISRRHARLEVKSGQVTVHDAGSSYGVFVNGSRTVSTLIWAGDQVQLGNTLMVLEADPPPPAPIPPPGPSTVGTPGVVYTPAPPTSGTAYPPAPGPASPYTPPPAASPGYGSAPGTPVSPYTPLPAAPGLPYAPPVPYAPPYGASVTAPAVPFAKWLYFLGFSFPPVGVIIGLVYCLKETPEERRVGIWCIIWSVIGGILVWVSWIALRAALQSLSAQAGNPGMSDLMKMIQGQ